MGPFSGWMRSVFLGGSAVRRCSSLSTSFVLAALRALQVDSSCVSGADGRRRGNRLVVPAGWAAGGVVAHQRIGRRRYPAHDVVCGSDASAAANAYHGRGLRVDALSLEHLKAAEGSPAVRRLVPSPCQAARNRRRAASSPPGLALRRPFPRRTLLHRRHHRRARRPTRRRWLLARIHGQVRFTPQRPQDELVPGHTAATQTNCRKSIPQRTAISYAPDRPRETSRVSMDHFPRRCGNHHVEHAVIITLTSHSVPCVYRK